MDATFWLGIVLGGLLGTVFDLWKRPLDRLLDRRLAGRSTTRADRLAQEVQRNRAGLRDYLVEVVLQTTLIGSLVGILAGVAFGFNGLLAYMTAPEDYEQWRPLLGGLSTAGQLVSIAGAAYIVRVASDALFVARKLNPLAAGSEASDSGEDD